MAWTYDSSLSNDKDRVRFLVGDVDTNAQLVQDEEIQWVLSQEANVYMAAASVAETIARKIQAGGFDTLKVGETSISLKRAQDLLALSTRLRKRGSTHMLPSAGGVFQSESDTLDSNTDIRPPSITRDLADHPGL